MGSIGIYSYPRACRDWISVARFDALARAYGVETRWIAGALVVSSEIDEELKVRDDELVFFVVAGYPGEEVVQRFPPLHEVCYSNVWGKPLTSGSEI